MAASDIWAYPKGIDIDTNRDITGYNVMATDGTIGAIDSASYDTARRWLIVDTGFWIFGKQRMIPAGAITDVNYEQRLVYVSMNREQIKDAPDLTAETNRDESYFDILGHYYGPYGL